MTTAPAAIPTLETGRLILRAPRLEDFEAYAATFASPRAVHMGILSRRDAWFSFANDVAGWALRGRGYWAITLRDGTLVGGTGLQDPDHFPEPEIGWLLHAGHEGRGYATEAARAALDWARGRLPSLVSYVAPGNAASIAVATRLGATHDPAASLPAGDGPADTLAYRHWGAA